MDEIKKTDARKAAVKALGMIWGGKKGAFPKDVIESLSGAGQKNAMDRRDRAFFMELTYGVLRHRELLDRELSVFLKKKGFLEKKTGATLNNLRAALYQILFMRTPERAAVHEAVRIEKTLPRGKPPLVNAVLRNATRGKEALLKEIAELRLAASNPLTDKKERIEAISTLTSHPRWLIKRWVQRLGEQEALAMAEANNRIPPLTLRVYTEKKDRKEILDMLRTNGIEAEETRWSPSGIKITMTSPVPFREMGFIHPFCTPQDEAAQLAGFLLEPAPGERVLDACAAPGGKTTHIAELMGDTGQVVAVDIDGGRMARLRENAARLGLGSITPVEADITEAGVMDSLTADKQMFDRVLVDAPCSSFGVIRRNPDIKYRHSRAGLAGFQARQLEILRAAARGLKTGGLLVYSTCTTEPEEGPEAVRLFLKEKPGGCFIIDMPGLPFLEPFYEENGSFLRTYIHRHDMDGFFMARLRRTC